MAVMIGSLLLLLAMISQLHAHPTNSPTNIFILAGQSNMAGRGGVHGDVWDGIVLPECRPNPSILRLSANLTWEEARDPLHKDIDVNKTAGVGPGMPFANGVLNKDPVSNHRFSTLRCWGTNITEWRRGKFLYNQLVNRASAAVKSGGIIRAMLWFQGESDTKIQEDALSYGRNLETFFTNVRADLRLPSLPIIQVAVTSAEGTLIDTIRQAQLGFKLPNVRCIDAKGLQLKSDDLHLTAESEGSKIWRMVKQSLLDMFTEQLLDNEGETMTVSNYDVPGNYGRYRHAKHQCKIIFYRNTSLKLVDEPDIPMILFDFVSFADINDRKNDHDYIIDIIGTVKAVGDIIENPNTGKKMIIFKLENLK
ncbi:OLC1v1016864C1 [Oldenlandia corymbosa var. corymbosa]|uniref:OLC1v1016864C1 n=1 Tax=Oldenlandia corymbosa var. corymbosa TaxID=529605 RepID=A0AAV1E847_OLDCO|nr:OLC1v1016864C1 [Oldenlandia corymbosa var. corymbosa]